MEGGINTLDRDFLPRTTLLRVVAEVGSACVRPSLMLSLVLVDSFLDLGACGLRC